MFWHNATFDLRGGADQLHWANTDMQSPSRRLNIKLGAGNDEAYVTDSEFDSSFSIDMGTGDDLGGMSGMALVNGNGREVSAVNGGSGSDFFGITSTIGRGITVRNVEGGYGF